MNRLWSEQAFHDSQARERARTFSRQPESLSFADAEYLDHEPWIRPALLQLGAVSGQKVLDLGCGHGMASVVLARRGAHVTALDLSHGYLAEARLRARANGVTFHFLQADGERLPFPDAAFPRIWGHAILHHLDIEKAGREIFRILKPDGVAVFCEPWAGNMVLSWARNYLPYPGKARTPGELPLTRGHLGTLKNIFPRVEVKGYQLLGMAQRALGIPLPGLNRCDRRILDFWPGLEGWCRYVVLTLRKLKQGKRE